MRIVLLAVAATTLLALPAEARSGSRGFTYGTGSSGRSHYVAPHVNRNGSYTGGHYRTNPDSTRSNNYGAFGNYNYHNNGVGNGYGRSVPRY